MKTKIIGTLSVLGALLLAFTATAFASGRRDG